jgi:hypothetical protein
MNHSWYHEYVTWALEQHRKVQADVGHASGSVFHLWHGSRANRRHTETQNYLALRDYRPSSDIKLDRNGLWTWARRKAEMQTLVRRYFRGRREDRVESRASQDHQANDPSRRHLPRQNAGPAHEATVPGPPGPGSRSIHACDVAIPDTEENIRWLTQSVESILDQDYADCTVHLIRDGPLMVNDPAQRRRPLSQVSTNANPAVVLTCHGAYLPWLRQCIGSIDDQRCDGERVVVFDGCEPPEWLSERPRWRVVRGKWHNPNPARNAGAKLVASPWIVWFDADNMMPPGFLASYAAQVKRVSHQVAFLYPDIQYVGPSLAPRHLWRTPVFDRWRLARKNFVDTSSCWRRSAVEAVGGWRITSGLDDWTLAVAMIHEGWSAAKSVGPAVWMRRHQLGRRHRAHIDDRPLHLDHVWNVRTFAIVTLLAPHRHHSDWCAWLGTADLPLSTSLVVVDNRDGAGPTNQCTARAADARDWRSVTVIDAPCAPIERGPYPTSAWWTLHRHVASLYRRALTALPADMVLLLEDDVLPPPNAVRLLHEHYSHATTTGAAGGAYPSREHPELVAASRAEARWGKMPRMADLEHAPCPIGMLAGGCTLYGAWALRDAMPIEPGHGQGGFALGWDGMLSTRLRAAGHGLILDGRVRCSHAARPLHR